MVFLFLDLPGELRNRIYEFVALNNGSPFMLGAPSYHRNGTVVGDRLLLRSISRQIQAEYTPIYLRLGSVSIASEHLRSYQSAFLSDTWTAATIPRTLVVRWNGFTPDFKGAYDHSQNLLPLLIHGTRPAGLMVKFVPTPGDAGHADICTTLNGMMTHKDPSWIQLLQKRRVRFAFLGTRDTFGQRHLVLCLNGILSELSAVEIGKIKRAVAGVSHPPKIWIQDRAAARNYRGEVMLEWFEL